MRSIAVVLLFCSLGNVAHAAAAPVATLLAAEPFGLDGYTVSTPGVTSWPLVIGDELTSPKGSVLVINFYDGSSVELGKSSHARIAGSPGHSKFVLLSGTLDFKLMPGSLLVVTSLDLERKRTATEPAPAPAETPQQQRRVQVPGEPKFLIPWSSGATLLRLPPVSRHY